MLSLSLEKWSHVWPVSISWVSYLKSRLYLQNWKSGSSRLNIADFLLASAEQLLQMNRTALTSKKHLYSNFSVGLPVELINLRGLDIKRIWKVSRIWFSESCIHLPFVVRNRTQRLFIPWQEKQFLLFLNTASWFMTPGRSTVTLSNQFVCSS